MSVTKLNITDLQFAPEEDPRPKMRRLIEEIRKLQQTANALIADTARLSGAEIALAPGEWYATVVAGSPPTFVIRYNDGGTIRTGSITLS